MVDHNNYFEYKYTHTARIAVCLVDICHHGAVDLFNKTGEKHLEKYDPNTGNKLKDPKPERTSKPS